MGIKNNAFKSESEEYETPNEIFEPLKKEFSLKLDVCASSENHKLDTYFKKEDDALTKDWHKHGNFWMNPPFSRHLKKWVQKAYEESQKGVVGVSILPVRSNTLWWHKYIIDTKAEVRFLKGEIKFSHHKRGLWLPFAIVIWKQKVLSNSIVPPSNSPSASSHSFGEHNKGLEV